MRHPGREPQSEHGRDGCAPTERKFVDLIQPTPVVCFDATAPVARQLFLSK